MIAGWQIYPTGISVWIHYVPAIVYAIGMFVYKYP